LNRKELTATVATRPFARRTAGSEPATSTWAMIQPPNTSPYTLMSAAPGIIRSTGIFPSGRRMGEGMFSGLVILKSL
jgi:hypothetical protein